MPTENDPISSLLRKLALDPATTKLLTILFSTVLIVVTAERTRKEWHLVSLLVIYSSALIYSICSLIVVIFKKQEDIGESACLKKIFCGRKVYWHEIQTCASFTLVVTHLSAITLVFAGEINRTEPHLIFTILNIFFFTFEWCFASKIAKSFVLEENFRSSRNCLEILLGPFHCLPTFFNLVRKGLFIASAILIAKSPLILSFMNVYYFHCIVFAVIASFLLFILQLCRVIQQRNSSTCASAGKWQTYFMLIITSYSFLAVLCLSLIDGYRPEYTSVRDYRPYYDYIETRHYPNQNAIYDHNTTVIPIITGSGSPPPPNARYNTANYPEHFNAPLAVPIPYILTCIAFILSFLDLYSRAIRSQAVPNHNDITIPHHHEITAPLHVHDGITKIEDLPIVVAAPHHFVHPQKQQFPV